VAGSAHEQENPGVRGEVDIANPFGSIVSSHDPRHPIVLTLMDRSTAITTSHHRDYSFGHLSPTATLPGKLLRHPRNLIIVELFSSPILFATGIHFSPVLLYNQGYPKVCPDTLNLPNAGDSFAGISSLSSCYLFSPDQGLNCFNLESSRVFFVKFPEPSLFQISELLHFIKIRKKFIKMQNQFCLNP
jgi:hypothetical protein